MSFIIGLTDAELRATPVPISGTVIVGSADVSDRDARILGRVKLWDGTDTALVSAAGSLQVDAAIVSGSVSISGTPSTDPIDRDARVLGRAKLWDGTDVALVSAAGALHVDGSLVTQPVSGTVAVSGTVPVSGPLTDAQLRATAVPISGTVTASGPLTDAQLRASAVKAREDLAAMTWVSVKSAAPGANAVQADTGALAAGDYDFDIQLAASDTVVVGKGLVIEHRNAANAATLQNLGGIAPSGGTQIRLRRYTIATNERIRVIAGTAAGAASSMYVSSIGRRLS
jgi:hypothetical protein